MVSKRNNGIVQDISIVFLSIILAFVMVKGEIINGLLESTKSFQFLGSLIAGMFFTTIFTTAPAMVALGEISKNGSIFQTALLGAFGALFGDLIIFRFIRDRLSDHLTDILKHERWWKRIGHLVFHLKYFRWFTFFLGGLILASPLPDELGISLLGVSKMKTKHFVPISFIFNFLGIVAIGFLAKSL